MTVSAAILKVVATLSSSEKGRKAIGVALLTPVIILLLVVGVFVALLTGLFGLLYGAVRDTSVSQSWNDIRKNVESALNGVNSSINTQIKNDTYDFMPDFSINLSKSVLQKTFSEGNNSFLLLYDTKEVNDSVAKAKKYIDKLKKVKSQKELEQINKEIDLSGYKYSDLAKDKEFRDDKSYDMSKYSQSTVQLINTLVKPEMPTYDYDEETVTIDGVKSKKQILTVHKDSKTQIVEYTCYGEGDIYLPRLLALYQAETFSRFEDMAESDASGLDNDIASAIENVSSDESGGATADGFDVACLNVFQAQEIGQIFERAALEGKFSAKVNTEKNDTTEKLSITVKTPSEDDWYEMFNVDEKYRDYTKENTQIGNCYVNFGIKTTSLSGETRQDCENLNMTDCMTLYGRIAMNNPVSCETALTVNAVSITGNTTVPLIVCRKGTFSYVNNWQTDKLLGNEKMFKMIADKAKIEAKSYNKFEEEPEV